MKLRLPLLPPCLIALAVLAACEKSSSPPVNNEAEIERKVQERVAQERQADQAQQLADKDAALRQKEKDLADREAEIQKQRDAQAQVAAIAPIAAPAPAEDEEAPPVVSNSAFYDSLAPYGQWLQVPGRDYVWQPFVAQQNPNWRPYQQGRWAYTDQGWTWVSEEPFGWATYHYGRWTRLREAGWVWVPGDEWAPAWVSWRESDDYVGWSPLPPDVGFGGGSIISYDAGYVGGGVDFCFVPITRFCEPRVVNYIVAQQYNVAIINKTTNITKIVRNRNQRTVAINNPGPQAAVIQRKTGREVKPLQIRPNRGSGTSQVSGNTLQVGVPASGKTGQNAPSNVRPLPVVKPAAQQRAQTGSASNGNAPLPNETLAQNQQRLARERQNAAPAQAVPGGNIVQAPGETFEQARQRLNRQENRLRPSQQNAPVAPVAPSVTLPQTQPAQPVMRTGDQIQPMERGQRQPNQAAPQRPQPQSPQSQAPQAAERAQRQAERAAAKAAPPATTTQPAETTGEEGKGNGNGKGNGGNGRGRN